MNVGRNQAKLQRNLMYLAAIADSQPQPPNVHSQYAAASGILQPTAAAHYHQQAQVQAQMTHQSLMAARSSMLYGAQPYPYPSLQQQQQALHNQLGMSSAGGLMLQGEPHGAGGTGGGGFPSGLQPNVRALSKQDESDEGA